MRKLRIAAATGLTALAWASAVRGESMTQFWLDQQAPAKLQPRRHILRPPSAALPRRPGFTVERRSPPERAAPERAPSERAVVARPSPAPVPAVPPAFVVGVFGDDFGAGLAKGLADGSAPSSRRGVVDQTGDDGELTRSDIGAWRGAIEAAISKYGRMDAAIVMLGGDETGLPAAPDVAPDADRTGWRALYGDQVEQLAAAFRDKRIPLIWVGLPPVRDADDSRRFLALNAIFKERAVKAGAAYVDSWEAFTDDNGQYDAVGPDVDGQNTKLRRSDGQGFTRAGARKLASFVEGDLKRERDRAESSKRLAAVRTDDQTLFDEALQIDINAQIRREAGLPPLVASAPPEGQTDGPVLALTAPPVTVGGRLATLYDAGGHLTGAAAATLERGLTPAPHPGRVDDFSWPRP